MTKGLVSSFGYALAGVRHVLSTQRNMRIHLAAALTVLSLAFYLKIDNLQICVLSIVIVLVMACEMFNTALEAAVDLHGLAFHPQAKIAKDVAAGAVLLAAAGAVVVGILIFVPEMRRILPALAAFARALVPAVAAIPAAKLLSLVTPKKWGPPSAVASSVFSLAGSLSLWAARVPVTLCLLPAALVLAYGQTATGRSRWPSLLSGLAAGLILAWLFFRATHGVL